MKSSAVPFGLASKRDILQIRLPLVCCREATLAGMLSRSLSGGWYKPHPALGESASRALSHLLPRGVSFDRYGRRLVLCGLDVNGLRRRVGLSLRDQIGDRVRNHCCRAFLRGSFLAGGYLQDPEKGYHLEIPLKSRWKIRCLRGVARRLRLPFRFCRRRGVPVAYLKERRAIIRFLQQAELFDRALAFEDVVATRRLSEMVNRQVNLETANISKRIETGERQIEAINHLFEVPDQDFWTDSLRLTALMRVKNPEDSLEALGKRFSPALSKSAVNHRLRRIMKLYRDLTGPK